MGNSLPIKFVGNANFDFIQHVQNVKFCQGNAAQKATRSWLTELW